ncbi:spatacsin [Trichonephila clavipes]|nr:spatacsin [Trichonephila clavipes]
MPLNIPNQSPKSSISHSAGIITAFTKHFPSVKRINDSLRKYSTSSGSFQPMNFSCNTEGLILKDLFMIENKLCFSYCCDSQYLLGIHTLDSDRPTMHERFTKPAFLIKSGSEEVPFPLLLFNNNKIFLVLYDIEQDKLVNELMIYPSSGTVEVLSSLNNWSNIHMDIEVLKLGLSNRQLYTVEFFLKTLFEGFCQLWNSPVTEQWVIKVKKEFTLWENVLNLVIDNVNNNLKESYSCQYAEQLLQITIGMIIQIIAIIDSKESDVSYFMKDNRNAFLSTFSKILLKMREFLHEAEIESPKESKSKDIGHFTENLNPEVLNQWKKWKKLPAEGIDINSKLLDIFMSTPEKDIRSLMLEELLNRNLLSPNVMESLHFVSLLEKLYPCTSFEHARLLLDEKRWLGIAVQCTFCCHFNIPPQGQVPDQKCVLMWMPSEQQGMSPKKKKGPLKTFITPENVE